MAIKQLYTHLTRFIETSPSKTVIGFSRSLLAADALLKLVFNNIYFLIPAHKLSQHDLHSLKYRCNFFLVFNSSHIVEMQLLAIVILGLVISGYFIKVTCLLHFWLSASFFMFRPLTRGVENIDMLLTLLLIPVCLFDGRKNHWNYPVEINKLGTLIQNLFLHLIRLQVCFIYFDSLHDKLFIKEWRNGTVIYYWFTHNFYGLHPSLINVIQPVLSNIPVLLVLAWGSLLLEALLAAAILFPSRFKLILLKCGIIFHFSILLIHGFTSLFFAMSAALCLYLYPAKRSFSFSLHNLHEK